MVFTKLSAQEKDAFFGLLDEYFQSRPELFGTGQAVSGLAGTGISPATAASAVQRALAANTTGGGAGKSNNPYAAAITAPNSADVARAVTAGRVAAASLAFSHAGGGAPGGGGPAQQGQPHASQSPLSQFQQAAASLRLPPAAAAGTGNASPLSLPWRGTSGAPVSAAAASAEQATPGSEVDKLVTRKASAALYTPRPNRRFFASATGVLSAFAKQPSAGASVPPALAAPRNTFGPPPVRRTTSSLAAAAGTRAPQPAPPEEEEEAAEGEWAEVLYDYSSEDPGDLAIEAGTRVFVTARSSEDWWSGQVKGQGREGLFPASYVKLL